MRKTQCLGLLEPASSGLLSPDRQRLVFSTLRGHATGTGLPSNPWASALGEWGNSPRVWKLEKPSGVGPRKTCVLQGASQGSALCLVPVHSPWALVWACIQRPTLKTLLWLVMHWSQSSTLWNSREAHLTWSRGSSRHLGTLEAQDVNWPLGD